MIMLPRRRVSSPLLFRFAPGITVANQTFSRASTATYNDGSQIQQTAASGALRNGHWVKNPVSGLWERSCLLELQRTNGWMYSRDIRTVGQGGAGVWTQVRCTAVDDGATTGPDGITRAYKLTLDATPANDHFITRSFPSLTDNTLSTLTFAAKAAGLNWICINTIDKTNVSRMSYVNVATGALGTVSASHTVRVTGPFNAFYRVECVFNPLAGATGPYSNIYLAEADLDKTVNGDSSSGVFLTDFGIEVDKPFATSVIPTAGSTVTRSADSLSFPFVHAPQVSSGLVEFIEGGAISTANAGVWYIGNAGNSGARLYIDSTGTYYRLTHNNGTSPITSTLAAAPTIGQLVRLRWILYADGSVQLGQSINGAAESLAAQSAANAPASAWSGQAHYLNSTGSSNVGCNAYRRDLMVRAVRTLAELVSLAQ